METLDILLGFYAILFMFCLVAAAVHIVGLAMIFNKYYEEPIWKAFIPLYNLYIVCKYTFGVGWLFLAIFIPGINIVVSLVIQWYMIKQLNRGAIEFIAVMLLGGIALIVISVTGDTRYLGPDLTLARTLGLKGDDNN